MGKIKIHPLFVIYVFMCTYFGWVNDVYYYIVTIAMHEWGHYVVAKKLHYNTRGVLFSVYGAGLQTNNCYKEKDDIIISLAGPIVNLIVIIICIVLWWVFPSTYLFTHGLFKSNVMVLLFNILPIYPLDGGRVIFALASIIGRRIKKVVYKINSIMCLLLGAVFLVGFVISLFHVININLLFIGMFMTASTIFNDNSKYFMYSNALNKNSDLPMEIKVFKVANSNKEQLYKYLSPHYYSRFEVSNGNSIQVVDESDLFKN